MDRLPTTMMPPMQKMAAPLALASALCHIATIAVIANMHIQPSTLRDTPAGPHRTLLDIDSAHDPLAQTVAQLEKAVDTHGARLTAVEEHNAEDTDDDLQMQLYALSSKVQSLVKDVQEIHESMLGPEPKPVEPEAERGLNTTHRKMQQGAAGDCDASGVCTARIITRTVVMQSAMGTGAAPQRGRRAQTPPCDFAAHSAAVMAACCPSDVGGGSEDGHSFRVDSGPCELVEGGVCVGRPNGYSNSEECSITVSGSMTLGACPVFHTEAGYDMLVVDGREYDATNCPRGVELSRGDQITWISDGSVASDGWEICAATSNNGHRRAQVGCSLPTVCPSLACARAVEVFSNDCSAELHALSDVELTGKMAALSQSCQSLSSDWSVARLLGVQCADSSIAEADCIPPCNPEHHGYILLLNIGGTDSRFSCNLANGLYSWIGAAAEGGYLGSDVQSFCSAVVSGAAGSFIVTVVGDAGVDTDIVVRLGQDVFIASDPAMAIAPIWGGGGFEVSRRAALSVRRIQIYSAIVILGGTVQVAECVVHSDLDRGMSVRDGGTATIANTQFQHCPDGAVWVESGSATISGSRFISNGRNGGGGAYVGGGAILMYAGASVEIVDSVFNDNVVYGHAASYWGGAILVSDHCDAVGGAPGATLSISGTVFSGNGGDGQDNAIYALHAQLPGGQSEGRTDSSLSNSAATAGQPLMVTGHAC